MLLDALLISAMMQVTPAIGVIDWINLAFFQ
jgi:hypothetical protein